MDRVNGYHDQILVVAQFVASGLIELRFRSCEGVDGIDIYRSGQRRCLALHSILIEYSGIIIDVNGIRGATRAYEQEAKHRDETYETSPELERGRMQVFFHGYIILFRRSYYCERFISSIFLLLYL